MATGQRRKTGHGLLSDGEESQWRKREEGGTHEERESEGPLPQAQHDNPVTATALMVMCQYILPSGFTDKTARIQHPGFVVDARRRAKMSTLI